MKRLLVLGVLALSAPSLAGEQAKTAQASTPVVRYGANATAGRTFTHDGIRLYYEVYGAGEPILMVHGNGGSIADIGAAIAQFLKAGPVNVLGWSDGGIEALLPRIRHPAKVEKIAANDTLKSLEKVRTPSEPRRQ